ncbi:MAG: GNAT family N-acetyltransferase [Pirellulales bacterium]
MTSTTTNTTKQRLLPEGYEIRAAVPEDLTAIHGLLKLFVDQKMILRRTKAELLALMATGFVAVFQDEVVGFASVEIYSKKLSEIQCLAVSQNHQGKGLGGALVAHCVQLARQRGVMEVMAISSSDKFLIDQGFDYSLPNQKKALFIQLRSREEVYGELEESGEE